MEHVWVEKHTGEIWKAFKEKLLYAQWLCVPLSYKYFRTGDKGKNLYKEVEKVIRCKEKLSKSTGKLKKLRRRRQKKKKRPVNDVKRAGPKTHLLLPRLGLQVCTIY